MAHAGEIEFLPVFAMVSQKRGVIGANGEEHSWVVAFVFQAEDGVRDRSVTGVQTCALPICAGGALFVLCENGEAKALSDDFSSSSRRRSGRDVSNQPFSRGGSYRSRRDARSFHAQNQIGRASCRERV